MWLGEESQNKELCKWLNFYYTNKRYMHKTKSLLENKPGTFWNTKELSNPEQKKKRTYQLGDFAVAADLTWLKKDKTG